MKKILGIMVLVVLTFSCSENNFKKALEKCATITYLEGGEGMIDNKYYYSGNDWVVMKDPKFLKKIKKMTEELPEFIPETKYYKKISNIHLMSFEDKVDTLHKNWVQIRDYSGNMYLSLNMMPYMLERSDILKKRIPKLSLKKKRDLVGFIDYYENCERKSKLNPETFKFKYK